jgi:flavin-dependent dehydrogenase
MLSPMRLCKGHIDPLTGEGIHTAMMGGKAAAETVIDMHKTGDFSKQSCKEYARRWYNRYGHDFFMSQKMAEVVWR